MLIPAPAITVGATAVRVVAPAAGVMLLDRLGAIPVRTRVPTNGVRATLAPDCTVARLPVAVSVPADGVRLSGVVRVGVVPVRANAATGGPRIKSVRVLPAIGTKETAPTIGDLWNEIISTSASLASVNVPVFGVIVTLAEGLPGWFPVISTSPVLAVMP